MSKESLEQFLTQVDVSEDLQEKIGEEIDIDAMIALGAEKGYEFSADDFSETDELSEEDLDGVAGGYVWEGCGGIRPINRNSRVDLNVGSITSPRSNRYAFRVTRRSSRWDHHDGDLHRRGVWEGGGG